MKQAILLILFIVSLYKNIFMPLLLENKSDKEIALMKDWAKVRIYMEENFEKKPDIQGFLFLIGVNEKGEVREYEKEEKQDLMHVGMCKLLEGEYFEYEFTDSQGWPHYKEIQAMPPMFIKMQESFLKEKIVDYFKTYIF